MSDGCGEREAIVGGAEVASQSLTKGALADSCKELAKFGLTAMASLASRRKQSMALLGAAEDSIGGIFVQAPEVTSRRGVSETAGSSQET